MRKVSPPSPFESPIVTTLVAIGVTLSSVNSPKRVRSSASSTGCSRVTFKSEPTEASTVFSSTSVPVYPCTAASVTMDNVSNIMTASRLTDSVEPEPLSPLLTSFSSRVLPKINCMIWGPFAPILPSSNAPPIHNANGPKMLMSPSKKKLEMIPSSLPLASSHVSTTASMPNRKASQ